MANLLYTVTDLTRMRTEADKDRKEQIFRTSWLRTLDAMARQMSLHNFKVVSVTALKPDTADAVIKLSFQNPLKKTTHAGDMVLQDVTTTEQLQKALEAVPVVEDKPAESQASFAVNDIRFVKKGSRIYVQSDIMGNLATFDPAEFIESNEAKIKETVAASVEFYGKSNGMTIQYELPKFSEITEVAVPIIPTVPVSEVQHFLEEPKVETPEISAELRGQKQSGDENAQNKYVVGADGICRKAEKALYDVLRGLKAENVKTKAQSASLKYDSKGFTGTVRVEAEFAHADDIKNWMTDIEVKENQVVSPNRENVVEAISAVSGSRAQSRADYRAGLAKLGSMVSTTPIQKEASVSKEAKTTPTEPSIAPLLRVNKVMLPESKVGDVIDIDGLKYTITSGAEDDFSKNGDGSFWTMNYTPQTKGKVDDSPRV